MSDIKNKIKDILLDERANKEEIAYILGEAKKLPSNTNIYWWNTLLENMDKILDIDSEYMLRVYKVITDITTNQSDLYTFLIKDINSKDEEYLEKSFNKILEILSKNDDETKVAFLLAKKEAYKYAKLAAQFLVKENEEIIIDLIKDNNNKGDNSGLYIELVKLKPIFFEIILELFLKNEYKYDFEHILEMMDIVNSKKDVILTVEEVNQAKNLIFNIMDYEFKDLNYKEKDINLIKDFLNNTLDKKDEKKYHKLAEKITKKLEKDYSAPYFMSTINKWIIKNFEKLNDPFYDKLKQLFFEINPTHSCETYFYETLINKDKTSKNVNKVIEKYSIPMKSYLIHLVHYLPEPLSVIDDIKFDEVKKNIEQYYDTFLHILDLVKSDSKIDLLTILYLKKEKETLNFLLDFTGKATSKKLKYHVTALLSGAYENYNENEKKEFSKKIIKLLTNKKKSAREIAVYLLIKWNLKNNKELLTPLLDDKSKEIVEMISDYFIVGSTKDSSHFNKKSILLKAKKVKQQIALPENTPLLVWAKNNSLLDEQFSQYIIYLLKDGKKVLVATEATKKILSLITEESLINFINFLYDNIDDSEKKSDWFLRAIPFTKDDKYLPFLHKYITDLISNYRGAAAAKVVNVISAFKTTQAIQLLDKISLKKHAKDARVNRAAVSSLDIMAKEMNLTKEDLLDYIIPTFGFSKDGILNLDFGARKFEVKLLSDLSLSIKDNKGKKFKNLPKVGKNDDPEKANEATKLFKSIKKDLKKQVKLEKNRLERGFSTARVWNGESWLKLFINNPIMRIFALNLIWGKYENGKLLSTFRYLEDGVFSDFEDNDIMINKGDKISLVHPIELCQEGLDAWREILDDYEINQPFEQINRDIYEYDEKEKESLVIKEFEGYMLGRFALKNGMTKFSWQRGVIEDAGCYYSYSKNYSSGYSFILSFLGDYIGNYDDNKEVPLFEISIYKNGKAISLKDIPKRLYSELHYELKMITDKGSGFNEKWQSVTW